LKEGVHSIRTLFSRANPTAATQTLDGRIDRLPWYLFLVSGKPLIKVYEIDGITPVVHPTAFVHPSAVLIGDVIVGAHCYVGPAACLRGDFGRIELEEGANVQDRLRNA